MTRSLALSALLGVLAGCSAGGPFAGDFAPTADTAGDAYPDGTLRLDVFPPAADDRAVLLPQSHLVAAGAYTGIGLELLPTVTMDGDLTGLVTRGWSIGAPATEEPLVATVSAFVADSPLGGVAGSDADGHFTLSFPAYTEPATVSFVPEDATLSPFRVLTDTVLDASRTHWDQHLPVGIPVYGRITGSFDGTEEGLAGVTLAITRTVDGTVVTSAPFTTDATGWYVARVEDLGDYSLEVIGGATSTFGRVTPSLSTPVTVESEDGVNVDVALGDVRDASAIGTVVDADGVRVIDAHVRLTARALDGAVGTVVADIEPPNSGDFVAFVLPGTYDVEVMAPPDDAGKPRTPTLYSGVHVSGNADLGALQLARPARLAGTVHDASGSVAANVLVTATEQGFDGSVTYTYTASDGTFSLSVPNVPLNLTLTPSGQVPGAVTTVALDVPATLGDITLDPGVPVEGNVVFGGAGIGYASIEVHDASSGLLLGQAVSDADGHFSLAVSVPARTDTDTAADTGGTAGDTGGADTPEDTGPADTASGDTGPADTASGDTGPIDTGAADTAI